MEATPTLVINYYSGFKQNVVPLFQRPYTWSEKQWRTLWEDVMVFYPVGDANDKATHFMGAVVTMPARSVPVGCAAFPAGAHDDQVDAWSQGAKRLLTVKTPKRTPQYVPQRVYSGDRDWMV